MRCLHHALPLLVIVAVSCAGGRTLDTGGENTPANDAGTLFDAGDAGVLPDAGDAGLDAGLHSDAGDMDAGVTDGGDFGDGGSLMDAGVYPAPFPPPPQVVNEGGPVFASPQFVPIFFSNDSSSVVSSLTTFVGALGTSAYWRATTQEYGVGDASAAQAITVAASELTTIAGSSSGTSEDAIKAWLTSKLNGASSPFPTADGHRIYVLFFPSGVSLTLGNASDSITSCIEFGGYHAETTSSSGKVPFVAIPRCSAFGTLQGIDAVTGIASHEMIEAAQDPFPRSSPAWSNLDSSHLVWLYLSGGGETADLCGMDSSAFVMVPGLQHMVQRSWSNASALAGHDPCVPELDGEVYFAAAAELPDVLNTSTFQTAGVRAPLGTTVNVTVDLYSSADTGQPWTVSATDLASGTRELDLALSSTSGSNGTRLQLSITRRRAASFGLSLFRLRSTLNGVNHDWYGAAGN